jgi:hypothetical protein
MSKQGKHFYEFGPFRLDSFEVRSQELCLCRPGSVCRTVAADRGGAGSGRATHSRRSIRRLLVAHVVPACTAVADPAGGITRRARGRLTGMRPRVTKLDETLPELAKEAETGRRLRRSSGARI